MDRKTLCGGHHWNKEKTMSKYRRRLVTILLQRHTGYRVCIDSGDRIIERREFAV